MNHSIKLKSTNRLNLAAVILSVLLFWSGVPLTVLGDDNIWPVNGHTPNAWSTVSAEYAAVLADTAEADWQAGGSGPCPDCCFSPGTLFQWSYGNSFSGGPDLDEPLVTDRPDFTEASTTVGLGVTQIEFGYTYTYNADDGTSERGQSIGEPLLRYGIFAEWLELRVGLLPVEQRITTGGRSNSTSGTEDLYLGFKIGLTPQECILPEMALIPQMTVPTGSNAFTNDETLPGVNWIYSWEINDVLSTAGSTQINRRVDGTTGNSYAEIAQSWTLAYTLTDNIGAYTEWFALIPHSADTDQTQHYFNGGFTYLISNDVQFDIRAGVGLNAAAADYFLGTGLSVRLK